jgi:hypothetical protein
VSRRAVPNLTFDIENLITSYCLISQQLRAFRFVHGGRWRRPHKKKPRAMLTEQELEEHPDNIEGLEGLDPSW